MYANHYLKFIIWSIVLLFSFHPFMKKFLWILLGVIVVLWISLGLLVKNPQREISKKILPTLWFEKLISQERLSEQTWDIFTEANLPFLQELTESSSGQLAQYIKNYVGTLGILAQQNQTCPNTSGVLYTWSDFICFKNNLLEYTLDFWKLWRWDLENKTPFMAAFDKLLTSIGYLSLSSLEDHNMYIEGTFTPNPQTFTLLNNQYMKDDKRVYFFDSIRSNSLYAISWADLATFQSFSSGSITAKDKNNYYVDMLTEAQYNHQLLLRQSGDIRILSGYNPESWTLVTQPAK